MANHWKCEKCGSMNIERRPRKKFETSVFLYLDEEGEFDEDDIGFGTKEEELNGISLFCKNCKNIEEDKFVLMPDTD